MTDPTIAFVLGTRPEIIKCAPVIRACDRRDLQYTLIHTGQHYSEELDSVFFDQLQLPVPEYNLQVGSGTHGKQTGEMIATLEELLTAEQPETVLVQGDTNSVLAGGIAASKLDDIEIGHIEAGLRSYDRRMPEEINRRVVDHLSQYLFAPTAESRTNLLEENVDAETITVTGNTIVDAIEQHVSIARERSEVFETLGIDGDYAVLTAHRAENVDSQSRFESLLAAASTVSEEFGLDIIYPIHPRARERLSTFDLSVPSGVRVVEPLDFLDFLLLEDRAEIVLTDSGGVQEESCILQTPCVTLRENTERPETVAVGANRIVGVDPADVRAGVAAMLDAPTDWENPFGDGTAARQILEVLETDAK